MGLFARREDLRAPVTSHEAHPTQGHGESGGHDRDEMGLLGLGHETPGDQLARLDLSSKPEDYFSSDPRHFHREVL